MLKISGREQPTNWLPELYDHCDLVRGLELSGASERTKLVEDALLCLLDARDLLGDELDELDEGGSGFVVKFASHDHMPPFDGRIQKLIRTVFPRLDAMNVVGF